MDVLGILPGPALKANAGSCDLLYGEAFAYAVSGSVAVVDVRPSRLAEPNSGFRIFGAQATERAPIHSCTAWHQGRTHACGILMCRIRQQGLSVAWHAACDRFGACSWHACCRARTGAPQSQQSAGALPERCSQHCSCDRHALRVFTCTPTSVEFACAPHLL